MALTISGDGQNFRTAEDLTDEAHDMILDIYLIEANSRSGAGLYAAVRAIKVVERVAAEAGWSPESVDAVGIVAGQMYGQVFAETAVLMRNMRRQP